MLMATPVVCQSEICHSDVLLETLHTNVQTYNVYKHSTFNLTIRPLNFIYLVREQLLIIHVNDKRFTYRVGPS